MLGYRMLLALSSVVYHIGQGSSNTIPTSFVVFHTTKNYISLWLKNCGLRMLIFKIPSIFIITGALLLEIILRRSDLFSARVRSIFWIWSNLRQILRERQRVQHVLRRKGVRDKTLFGDTKAKSGNILNVIRSVLQATN
jgi:GT2 family glycosyltransferase